jgi:hypothetical protein
MKYLKFGASVLAVLVVYNILIKPFAGSLTTPLVGF